jgi:aminoglycoside phosphotransferase (APT) family kinase protein
VTIVPLGRGGDHVAYLVDDRLVVRFRVDGDAADAAASVTREARVLAVAGELSPLPVPRVEFVEPGAGCLAYELLPGVPLLGVAAGVRAEHAAAAAAERLGRFLRALHAVPRERVASLVEADDPPMADWLAEAAEHYAEVHAAIPDRHRRTVEAFLEAAPPDAASELVFSHNDLGIEHVLVDARSLEVTGVIDWSDAALVDPARDFGLVLRDLGPDALDIALAAYRPGGDAGLRERAGFYAGAALLEDLAFGLETGRREYVEKSLTALDWLFTP